MKNPIRQAMIACLMAGSVFATAQTPQYNSYPSASAVILLDFDGHLVSGTAWNSSGNLNCNGSGLNNDQLTEVFNRVAEDFRPFNVNVTTVETKYNQAPVNKRMRVIITTSHEWYGTNAGGVAYLNSFTWGDDTPCFVFSALHNYNIKNISEASSHEAGHTLGLRHQSNYDASCTKISDYHWGVGSGEIGWAPIMGAGYSRNMTLWHNGPNSLGCTNYQTDLSVITSASNFGYRTDDYSATMNASATLASFNSNQQFTINGVIERTDDKDVFRFIMPSIGTFKLDAIPYNVGTGNSGSDLDLQVELINSSLTTLGVFNPSNVLSSIIDTVLSAGTYYLRIDGLGNIYAPEYGSLGSYSLMGTFIPNGTLPLRKLELKGNLDRDWHQLKWIIDADESVISQVIEVSSDGTTFNALYEPLNAARDHQYKPLTSHPLRYRLHVTFDNHRDYYSNVITIKNAITPKPEIIGNLVQGQNLTISSPADYSYQVIDPNGRLIRTGNISKGFSTIQTGAIASGMYVIRFISQESQWSLKFVKN